MKGGVRVMGVRVRVTVAVREGLRTMGFRVRENVKGVG